VHVAAYSPRPGTFAWRHLEDDVPQAEKMRRLHAVEALQERVSREINEALLGTTQEVLAEGENESTFTGRTRTNKLVHFRATAAPAFGKIVPVRIDRFTAWSLQGELIRAGVIA
jgi:tRNA-2-methylthio-N6-dimethylallyladenosine synthase